MSEGKVNTILEWIESKKVQEVQSFLGFANIYKRFIEAFSKLC
jgi:hypothetical protein